MFDLNFFPKNCAEATHTKSATDERREKRTKVDYGELKINIIINFFSFFVLGWKNNNFQFLFYFIFYKKDQILLVGLSPISH